MTFPGRILPRGGVALRGEPCTQETFSPGWHGDLIELALPGEDRIHLTIDQAQAIADAFRYLTPDTGNVHPSIQLYSGKYFDFTELADNDIEIEDVAHGLSNTGRFGGHGRTYYSVAEHSVRASYVTPPEHAYAALMHDSSESVLVDVPTPIKRILRDYQLLEDRVERFMGWRFKYSVPLHEEVKRADLIMLATEKRDLKPNSSTWEMLQGVPMLDEEIVPWSPSEAKAAFLARYQELRP